LYRAFYPQDFVRVAVEFKRQRQKKQVRNAPKVSSSIGPEKLDQLYFQVSRKSGSVVFSLVKMWERDFLTSPENVSRKCGGVIFSHLQKMWECDIFTCLENVGE
jgi:hypothetical protein